MWPLSRTGFPKLLLCYIDNDSTSLQAAQRLAKIANDSIQVASPLIVAGKVGRYTVNQLVATDREAHTIFREVHRP